MVAQALKAFVIMSGDFGNRMGQGALKSWRQAGAGETDTHCEISPCASVCVRNNRSLGSVLKAQEKDSAYLVSIKSSQRFD